MFTISKKNRTRCQLDERDFPSDRKTTGALEYLETAEGTPLLFINL